MSRRMNWLLVSLLWIELPPIALAFPQNRAPADAPEAADEARERKVMERFLAVLEKTPRRGTALDRVYGYHVERGTLDGFLKGYQAKVSADPKDGTSWLLIGLVEAQRGRDAAAVEAFRKAESTRPEDSLPSYYLGQALVLVGQPDAASEAFERALTRKPARADLLDVYQALGRVHQRAHRNDKALAVWDRLEKAFPDDPRVQEQIAHALADEGQDAPALARFEGLAKSTRDKFRQVQFSMEAAELKVRLGKSSEALVDFENLLGKLDPESWLYREVRRKVEDVFLRTDDLAGLATYYERWIKKTPDDVEAMARLGRTLASQGRVVEARKWLDEAVKLAPSRRELRLALIEQLAQDRKFAEAASQYEALAKLEPNNPDVVRDWGRMLLRDTSRPEPERKKSAANVWRRLAPNDAKDAVMVAQAADLFRQAGLSDEAIALYQRAIKLAPESTQYREYLGEYYHALKRPADALATWRLAAEGPARNARSLGRLGEVLAGFGYRKEAVEPLTEACKIEPDDFDLRLKLADLKLALELPLEALTELEKAEKVASAEEQTEAVLDRQIKAYQASGTLASRIEGIEKGLADKPTAAGWTRLARLLEADQKAPEAARAIGEATKLDPKSVAAWVATARLREAAGDLLGASEALRTLTNLDRRSRTDYLTGIAKLEARLGRRGPALEAGRELLAAAPGNPENHQFFAELCFGLGEAEEGLDALRRSARANPSDPKAMLTLAENLARQFRGEEAIELYWRAFAKTLDVEGKLSIVGRMADQYLQRNQLDRLIARLERELREPNQQRELALCLAQAHSTSGDYSTARMELERLVAGNPRDNQLLTQLSTLAEQEGDLSTAAKYQKQALELAPSPEGNSRLAQLYFKAGEISEAEVTWSRLASENDDPSKIWSAVDHLLSNGKAELVLTITERMLVKQPGDWEALYREGVALEALGKPTEAARRFRAILDLKLSDDEPSLIGQARSKNSRQSGGSNRKALASASSSLPILNRMNAVYEIRVAAKLEEQSINPGGGGNPPIWTPSEFGQARMACLGWLDSLAQREQKQEIFIKETREARDKSGQDPRLFVDWYYLQLLRTDGPAVFEAASDLVKKLPGDPSAEYAFLASLGGRVPESATPVRRNPQDDVDKTPPLAGEDLERALASYRDLRKKKPDLSPTTLLGLVSTELKRAKREAEADILYKEVLASSQDAHAVDSAIELAAGRGNVEDLLALQEKVERLRASQATPGSSSEHPDAFAQVMSYRADAKAYGDVLRLLDRYLSTIRSPEAVTRRSKSRVTAAGLNQVNYRVWIGKSQRFVNLDYPQPNAFFDFNAIQILRNAFELYLHDDLLSDLTAHFKAEFARLPDAEKIYPLLASGYLAWWNDDKDEAISLLSQAVELAKGDVDLRLGLAEIQARRGEAADALELVDGFEPLDQKTVQRREVMALRLAVMTGDVERARKASERLFGLRLDADTQLQLAAQMNQLGMHELSEAVLGRARRRAGGNTSTLVSLMLQYQQSGKTDTAFQVANQILRTTANKQFSPYGNNNNNNNNEEDAARTEAILVFARSGKLKELIDRAEAQLQAAPNSVQVLQSLVDYYKADNQEDKVKETFARLAKLRPDDAKLRFQIASQMLQAGDSAGAIENYTAVIKKEPAIYVNNYWEIQNAFQQAGKLEELGKLFDDLDIKVFSGNPWIIQQIITSVIQDEKTRELGVRLFRKMWKAHPEMHPALIANLDGESLWQLPEIYDYVREAVIPSSGKSRPSPWTSLDQVYSWDGNGRVSGILTRLMEGAAKQNKLEALARDIDEAIKRYPEWSGGRAIKAVILVRRGKVADARAILEDLMAREKEIPASARMIIGQELDAVKALLDIELKLYAGAVDDDNNGMEYQYGPAKRLVSLLHESGKDAEAREVVLKCARKSTDDNYGPGNQAYAGYQRLTNAIAYGQQMVELGYPADAVRFYQEILGDSEALEGTRQVYGGQDQMVQQVRMLLDQTLTGMNPKNLGQTLLTLVSPPARLDPKAKGKAVTPPVDLVLLVAPRELDKANITSLFFESLRMASKSKQPGVISEVKAAIARRVEAAPDDLSASIASALVAIAEQDSPAIATTSARLAELVQTNPLDTLAANTRPNARQRADAFRHLGVWLVARECLKSEPLRKQGSILEARALDAAQRQSDSLWSLAILREGGQSALDRGDRATAEVLWRQMLRKVLTPPTPSKTKKTDPNPATKPKVSDLRKAGVILLGIAQVPPPVPPTALVVTTYERFEQAAQIARLASEHDMHELSAEAIRDSLGGGPPVVPMAIDGNPNNLNVNNGPNGSGDPTAMQVEDLIFALDASWTQHKMPPGLAYEALRAAVLPESRPAEVFLYPRPLGQGEIEKPRSVGAILARRAVEAGKVDDLRRRIEARQDRPMAVVPSRVLAAQVAIAAKDEAEVVRLLKALAERLSREPLQNAAELICHASIPALELPGAAGVALPIVEFAAKTMAGSDGNGQETLGPLLLSIARRHFKEDRLNDARNTLKTYIDKMQEWANRNGGDYSLYLRKQVLATVATEFAKAGRVSDTWELLGRFADAPMSKDFGMEPPLGGSMSRAVRLLLAMPSTERYVLLKDWSMPTKERKSIRRLTTFVPEDQAIPAKFGPMTYPSLAGIASTTTLLIDAAKEAGKLDDLINEVRKADDAKIENARTLLILAQISSGRGSEAKEAILARIEELKKPQPGARNLPDGQDASARAVGFADYLISRAALTDRSLDGPGETSLES